MKFKENIKNLNLKILKRDNILIYMIKLDFRMQGQLINRI